VVPLDLLEPPEQAERLALQASLVPLDIPEHQEQAATQELLVLAVIRAHPEQAERLDSLEQTQELLEHPASLVNQEHQASAEHRVHLDSLEHLVHLVSQEHLEPQVLLDSPVNLAHQASLGLRQRLLSERIASHHLYNGHLLLD
jgi:hypothetical protein